MRLILGFTLPTLLGMLFQQLYNMVDTWVVGNFVSNEAFSAVGTVAPSSICSSAASLAFPAAPAWSSASTTAHDARRGSTTRPHGAGADGDPVCSIHGAGHRLYALMLRLMNTPAEVFPESSAYLTIYFGGISGY